MFLSQSFADGDDDGIRLLASDEDVETERDLPQKRLELRAVKFGGLDAEPSAMCFHRRSRHRGTDVRRDRLCDRREHRVSLHDFFAPLLNWTGEELAAA